MASEINQSPEGPPTLGPALWAVSFLYALTVRRFSAVVVTLLRQVVRSWSSDSHVLGLMSRSLRERVLALTEFSIQ